MISCEATGKNIEQAVENALFELKAQREDVDIKILSEGGFLKKAKVLVTISEDAREKYEKKEKLKKELRVEEEKAEEKVEKVTAEPKKEVDFSEEFMKKKIEKTQKAEKTKAEPEKQEAAEVKAEPQEILEKVLAAVGLEAKIERTVEDEYVKYSVTGDDLGELIGHRGEGLYALESFLRIASGDKDGKRILLEIGNFRAQRAEKLKDQAKRWADVVVKTGKYHCFEPMNPSERKILHMALQNDDRVATFSRGEDPKRYVIIFPRNYEE